MIHLLAHTTTQCRNDGRMPPRTTLAVTSIGRDDVKARRRIVPLAAESLAGAAASPIYCIVIAIWTTAHAESWKRTQATLAFTWRVEGYEENEAPRPEFLGAFKEGRWRAKEHGGRGAMRLEKGFYDRRGRFISLASKEAAEEAQRARLSRCPMCGASNTGLARLARSKHAD